MSTQAMRCEDDQVLDKSRFANAVAKMMTVALESAHVSCYTYGICIKRALAFFNITAELRVGFAAWRVGPEISDVISHVPQENQQVVNLSDKPALMYHAWLEVDDNIVDFTTHQLRLKAAELDKMDGFTTNVEWCPLYLWQPKSSSVTYRDICNGSKSGTYFYRHVPNLQMFLSERERPIDAEYETDVQILLTIYNMLKINPDLQILGRNNIFGM